MNYKLIFFILLCSIILFSMYYSKIEKFSNGSTQFITDKMKRISASDPNLSVTFADARIAKAEADMQKAAR